MSDIAEIQAKQHQFWNGPGGAQWVARNARTDAALVPVTTALLTRAAVRPGETVLDIGCGCGTTTMMIAEAAGPSGHVTGLDISAPMLDFARERAKSVANITWALADATAHEFPEAQADLLFSRFGVMFFADPVAAFANMRRALRPGGRVHFAAWRAVEHNPWMGLPTKAVAAHVPDLPRPGPEDPGPFAFASVDRVTRIMTEAGFAEPVFTHFDQPMTIGATLDEAVRSAVEIGPAARALMDQPEQVRAAAMNAVREVIVRYATPQGPVVLPGSTWLVQAAANG